MSLTPLSFWQFLCHWRDPRSSETLLWFCFVSFCSVTHTVSSFQCSCRWSVLLYKCIFFHSELCSLIYFPVILELVLPAPGCPFVVSEIPDFSWEKNKDTFIKLIPYPSPSAGSGQSDFVKFIQYQLSQPLFAPLLFRLLTSPSSQRQIPSKDGKRTTKIPSSPTPTFEEV